MLENQDVNCAPGNNLTLVRSRPTTPVAFMLRNTHPLSSHPSALTRTPARGSYRCLPLWSKHHVEATAGLMLREAGLWAKSTESVPFPPSRPRQIGHRWPSPRPQPYLYTMRRVQSKANPFLRLQNWPQPAGSTAHWPTPWAQWVWVWAQIVSLCPWSEPSCSGIWNAPTQREGAWDQAG